MRLSKMMFKTLRDDPSDAELISHKLLVRADYIKRQGMGSYMFLPLGIRVLRKIENIIREEMDNVGLLEVSMPKLLSEDVYATRLKSFGDTMFRLKDRNGKGMCLGPTHEEVFTLLVKDMVSSYKQLPVGLYQIGVKFRDEIRPRFGLQRSKEFEMKDAYTYHTNKKSLDEWYDKIKEAYNRVFRRLELDFVPVLADNGTMGGSDSQEFMVKSAVGEDELVCCEHCGYAANIEKAVCIPQELPTTLQMEYLEKVHTPNTKTIEDVSNFLHKQVTQFVKSVVYSTDKGIVLALVRGDRDVEEIKLQNIVGASQIELATAEQIKSIGSVAGYVGATKDLHDVVVIADNEVKQMTNFVMGANETDMHYKGCNQKDLTVSQFADIRKAQTGDACPQCGKPLHIIRGIEVGHIFKLGTRYTKELNCKYLDENGKEQIMEMGCYGIGVTRAMSATVEQHNDEKGIVWPEAIAPYKVAVVIANQKNEEQVRAGEELYNTLANMGVEVLLDDRKESIGVKLNDAELIGVPYIIVAGKAITNNEYEFTTRKTLQKENKTLTEIKKFFS